MEVSYNVDAFVDGYIECALWAGMSEEDRAENDDCEFVDDDLSEDAVTRLQSDARSFFVRNRNLLDAADRAGRPYDHLGHDLFLTRNGHGAGFWDRGLGRLGDVLTERANAVGERILYLGDDGKVHID